MDDDGGNIMKLQPVCAAVATKIKLVFHYYVCVFV
jgi:hypothetical protein